MFSRPRPPDEPPNTTPEPDPATEAAYNRFEETYGRADTPTIDELATEGVGQIVVADAKRKFLTVLEVWYSRRLDLVELERQAKRRNVASGALSGGGVIIRDAERASERLITALDAYVDAKLALHGEHA
jgi:hypothetical protein